MNNKATFLICIAVIGFSACAMAEYYSGGTGEPNDPFIIATPEDLNDIGNHIEHWDKHFVLANDVNLAQYTGTQFKIIGTWLDWWHDPNSMPTFRGVFDGNNHKVWNFTWDSYYENYIGLFGCVGNGGKVKNLGLENVYINAVNCYYVGSLVGKNVGTISNCYTTGNIDGTGYWIGGLVGLNIGLINKCYSTSNLHSAYGTGGLVGLHSDNGVITWCHATGNSSSNGACSGLVSWTESGAVITNCYSTGDATGNDFVGGIVGYHEDSNVINCYSHSNIIADSYTGGLVGYNLRSTITNCYSTGKVTANYVFGGLVGNRHNDIIQASFWDKQTSSVWYSPGGVGKTTVEMQNKSTFTDESWDFIAETENGTEDIWTINENVDYPRFVWQLVDCDGSFSVDFTDYAALTNFWLDQNCADSNNCDGTDFDFSGNINSIDLSAITQHWLRGL